MNALVTVGSIEVRNAAVRQHLFPMLILAFATLHPDEPPLQRAWYLRAICYLLERVEIGQLLRAMIWLQPRALKSITVAIVYPCWLLGRDPSKRIMVATYGEALSRDHDEKRRQIMNSEWYKEIFPNTVISPRGNRMFELQTTANGGCSAVSVGGTVTGRGADIIILDDCMKADDQNSEAIREGLKSWYSSTLSTRLNDKSTGAIVSIQQRLHEDDLPAHLLERGFECLNLPAIAPDDLEVSIAEGLTHSWHRGDLLDEVRFPMDVLEAERLTLGPQAYSAQYLQNPVAPEGNLIRIEHFNRYEGKVERHNFDHVVQSWDTASSELETADWSVCTTWGIIAGRAFLLDIYRQRVPYPKLKQAVIAQWKAWNAKHVIVERASSGISLCQQVRKEGPFKPIAWPPRGQRQLDKAERLIGQTGQIEEGRVWLPARMDGLDTFLSELRAFPNGRHDDQVDSLTQMLEYILHRWRKFEEQRTESGRLKRGVHGKRPPLPSLPDFVKIRDLDGENGGGVQ